MLEWQSVMWQGKNMVRLYGRKRIVLGRTL